MAGPEEAAQQARMAEEAKMREEARAAQAENGQRNNRTFNRRSRDTDKPGNFNERTDTRRQTNTSYRNRRKATEDIRQKGAERDRYEESMNSYKDAFDKANDMTSAWHSVYGERNVTYDDVFDFANQSFAQSDEGRANVEACRATFDRHPEAVIYANSGGFRFADVDDDPEAVALKAKKMRFLHNAIRSYNEGTYSPYYDREKAYKTILQDGEYHDGSVVFDLDFEAGRSVKRSSESFKRLSQQYGVSTKTLEKWYKDVDKVVLAYECEKLYDPARTKVTRDPDTKKIEKVEVSPKVDETGKQVPDRIEANYRSLFLFSNETANLSRAMNAQMDDGVYADNLFDTAAGSAAKHHGKKTSYEGMEFYAHKIDECNKDLKELKEERTGYTNTVDKVHEKPFKIGGGLQAMYDAEMDRYRNGFVQQPPMMLDMVKRYGREKTRFFDSRREAKEQMREQKWSKNTGINERGIKGDNFFDLMKTWWNECRLQLAISGVTDFSAVGDTEKLFVALGIDAAQNAFDSTKYRIERLRNRFEEKAVDKVVRNDDTYDKMFGLREEDFDTSNYTKTLQIASEAQSGAKNADESATADYDGRENNPADIMSGWDDGDNKPKQIEEKKRNLQNLLDDNGYNTDNDGPNGPDGPSVD